MYAYLKPYRGRLLVSLFCMIVVTSLALSYPKLLSNMLEAVNKTRDYHVLNSLLGLVMIVVLTQALFQYFQTYLLAFIGERILLDLRSKLYNHLQGLSLEFFARQQVGDLLSRIGSDVAQMRTVLTTNIASLLGQTLMFLGSIIIMFRMNARLSLFLLAIVSPVALLAAFFSNKIQRFSSKVQNKLALSTVVAEEGLRGVYVVKSFGREGYQASRYSKAMDEVFRAALRVVQNNAFFLSIMNCMIFAAVASSIWFGGREVIASRLTLGEITGFLVYGFMLTMSVQNISNLFTQVAASFGGVQRVFELLDLRPAVQDAPGAEELKSCQGNITFQDVSFTYEEGNPVIQNLSLDIRCGEVLAIVGPSGAGKSTLINLVARFYDPTGGRILIDGKDVRSITQASLRSHMAIVPQDTMLFATTVRENLLFGRLDATEAEMIRAAKDANAHEFIMELPNQYDNLLGERGITLSGGQRQRIAIARAILRGPRILLLDEATSALDNESEGLVQESLNALMKDDRTTLVIAHRLSTVKAANRIAVIDRGRLTELGTHEELMGHNALYSRLYAMQFRNLDGEAKELSTPFLAP